MEVFFGAMAEVAFDESLEVTDSFSFSVENEGTVAEDSWLGESVAETLVTLQPKLVDADETGAVPNKPPPSRTYPRIKLETEDLQINFF